MYKIYVIGTRGFPDVQGGIEKHCEELYSRLAGISDLEITVIAIDKYCRKMMNRWNNISFKYLSAIHAKSVEKLHYGLKASIIILFQRPDLVHVQGLNCAIFIPLLKLFGLKVVFTQHSRDYLYPKWGMVAKFIWRISEKAGLRADAIIAVSDQLNEHLQKSTSRSVVINNGINLNRIITEETEEEEILKKHELVRSGYIFFAGRFTAEKSIEDLINAFNRLNDDRFKLVLAGDADHDDSYSSMIKNLALGSTNVVLTGFVAGKELQVLFTNAKLFVLPSKFEGFPIVLLEALSYGIEILASDIEANLQLGLGKANYYNLGDIEDCKTKMQHLLNSSIHDGEIMERQRMLKDRFDWDIIAGKTYDLYREIL